MSTIIVFFVRGQHRELLNHVCGLPQKHPRAEEYTDILGCIRIAMAQRKFLVRQQDILPFLERLQRTAGSLSPHKRKAARFDWKIVRSPSDGIPKQKHLDTETPEPERTKILSQLYGILRSH